MESNEDLTGMTPPSEIGEMPEKPPGWPTGIGVLGIVLASLGYASGCCGVVYPFVMERFIDMMSSGGNVPQEQIDAMKASQMPAVWMIPASLVGLMMSTLLMVGAIKVVRRRSGGVRLCQIWAWFAIPWSVLGFSVAAYFQMQAPPNPQMGAAGQYIGIGFSACLTLVLGIGVPLFMLAWFSREKSKEEIRSWDLEAPARI